MNDLSKACISFIAPDMSAQRQSHVYPFCPLVCTLPSLLCLPPRAAADHYVNVRAALAAEAESDANKHGQVSVFLWRPRDL